MKLDPTLLQSGWLLIASGFLLNYLRSIPFKIYAFFLRWFTIHIECPDNSTVFIWVRNYLGGLTPIGGVRSASVFHRLDENQKSVWRLPPAPGWHYYWYKGRLIQISRYRKELESGSNGGMAYYENIGVRFFFCGRAFVEQFMDAARQSCIGDKNTVTVWFYNGSHYMGYESRPRQLNSVILPPGVKERLTTDLEKFYSSQAFYNNIGVPHRRGVLLTGSPGNGKTSVIRALASYLKKDIAVINLNTKGLDDAGLQRAFCDRIVSDSFVILEDVDCLFDGRASKDSQVSFSGLLNAIDGVASSEGCVLFMTTNHPENLDPAMIRPGRIDIQIEITNVVRRQAVAYFNHFYGLGHEALAQEFGENFDDYPGEHSMAAIQNHLLLHKNDPQGAVRNFGDLYES